MKAILGTKLGMTQIIAKNGEVVPVTILSAAPNTITQIKTPEIDGYTALQVAYGTGKNASKSVVNHLKKAGIETTPKFIREFRCNTIPEETKLGDQITVASFTLGDKVTVTGTSKGKGFAGTVKRHNFQESKHTHGGNGNVRRPGSIGSMYPQKVIKGKRMAGRMGADRVTVKNLEVAFIDTDKNLLGLRGAVPGPNRGLIFVEGKE